MLRILTNHEAEAALQQQRGIYALAVKNALERYPGTDPMVLLEFGMQTGGQVGLLDHNAARELVTMVVDALGVSVPATRAKPD